MSVRLAPPTIISNVHISAACSETLRSRISALVRGLRLGSFTTPPLDQSGRGGREPIELWQPMASTHWALSLSIDCTKRYGKKPQNGWPRGAPSTPPPAD